MKGQSGKTELRRYGPGPYGDMVRGDAGDLYDKNNTSK